MFRLWLNRLVRRLVRRFRRGRRPFLVLPSRPRIEPLEVRLLPTVYTVTTTKDILGDTTPGELTLRNALTALDGTPSGNATTVGTASNTIQFNLATNDPGYNSGNSVWTFSLTSGARHGLRLRRRLPRMHCGSPVSDRPQVLEEQAYATNGRIGVA